jgi:hypothetical protein
VQHRKPGDQVNCGYKSCRILFTDKARLTRGDITTQTIRTLGHRMWWGNFGNNPTGPHVFEECSTTRYYRNVLRINHLCIQMKYVLKHEDECGCNMTGLLHVSAEICHGIFERKLWRNMDSKKWNVRSPYLKPLYFFLWDCMDSKVYRNGNPAGRRPLMERTMVIRNTSRQWHYSMALRLAACIQGNGGHFEHVLCIITFKLECCCNRLKW